MSADPEGRLTSFLADLTELSRKHGVKLYSCGCCGGINADAEDEPTLDGDYRAKRYGDGRADTLRFLKPGEKDWDEN